MRQPGTEARDGVQKVSKQDDNKRNGGEIKLVSAKGLALRRTQSEKNEKEKDKNEGG